MNEPTDDYYILSRSTSVKFVTGYSQLEIYKLKVDEGDKITIFKVDKDPYTHDEKYEVTLWEVR